MDKKQNDNHAGTRIPSNGLGTSAASLETNHHARPMTSKTTKEITAMQSQNQVRYVPAGSGPMYWGPGDKVTFLVTGAQSGGACFIIEVMVPPGGGPPPHIHYFEEESFYILEGTLTIQSDGQTLQASPGDFIHIPRGTEHSFRNDGKVDARMLATISPAGPAGVERFFEETFYRATDRSAPPPLVTQELMGRMMAAATRNGLGIVHPA
jgi:quercetin dioxygenase-like cupin family protein